MGVVVYPYLCFFSAYFALSRYMCSVRPRCLTLIFSAGTPSYTSRMLSWSPWVRTRLMCGEAIILLKGFNCEVISCAAADVIRASDTTMVRVTFFMKIYGFVCTDTDSFSLPKVARV